MKLQSAKEFRQKESVQIRTEIAAKAMAKTEPTDHAKWHMKRRPYGLGPDKAETPDEEQKNESM